MTTIDYGTVTHDGRTIKMTAQAEPSSRVFPGGYNDAEEGEGYISEWQAPGVDVATGDRVLVRWQFAQTKGSEQEPDTYDWDDVYDVIDR